MNDVQDDVEDDEKHGDERPCAVGSQQKWLSAAELSVCVCVAQLAASPHLTYFCLGNHKAARKRTKWVKMGTHLARENCASQPESHIRPNDNNSETT